MTGRDQLVSDARLNEALAIFQAFGPERAIPVAARWKDAFPGTSDETLAAWEALFQEAEAFAYSLAERRNNGALDLDDMLRMIRKEYPWLDGERIDRLCSQAMYFVLK